MNRIKELRKRDKVKQADLAKSVNVTQAALSGYETGKYEADTDTYRPATPTRPGYIRVPVLGRVAAGIPIDAIEEIIDWEDISTAAAGDGEYFGLQIKGHSMEPKISDGDVVIVRRQPDVDSGDIAVVLVNGDDATVKKVKKSPQGVTLIPSNPAYEPMYYTNAEIESLPVQILGRVVELRAKF